MNKTTRYTRIALETLLLPFRLIPPTIRIITALIAIPPVWLAMKICKGAITIRQFFCRHRWQEGRLIESGLTVGWSLRLQMGYDQTNTCEKCGKKMTTGGWILFGDKTYDCGPDYEQQTGKKAYYCKEAEKVWKICKILKI